MKLLLINICPNEIFYPTAMLCLYSYLKSKIKEIEIKIIAGWEKAYYSDIIEFNPDIIGISVMTPEFEDATGIATNLKTFIPNTPIIIGGVHVTILPETIRKCFDIGVIGEGEETLYELVTLFEKYNGLFIENLKEVKGIIFWNGDNKIKTEYRKPLDLNNYPLIDYSIVPQEKFKIKPIGAWGRFGVEGLIESSRGCPFRCIFCASTRVWNGIRYFPIKWVVSNLITLINLGCTHIHLSDELFAANKKRLRQMIIDFTENKIQERVQLSVTARTSFFDEEFCDLLKAVGVTMIFFGFESNSHRVLQLLKGETCDKDDNCNAVKICYKKKMECWGAIMLGAPTETEEEMMETINFIKWCKKYKVRRICVGTLVPFPGTPVWDIAKDKGLVHENMDFTYFKTVINAVTEPLVAEDIIKPKYKEIRLRAIKAAHSYKWNKAWSLFKDSPSKTIRYAFEAPFWIVRRLFDATQP